MKLSIPATSCTWPMFFAAGTGHWNGKRGGGCIHGPCSQSWPWWKLISALYCRLGGHDPVDTHVYSSGRRLWVYFDLWVNRRTAK